MTSSDNTNTVSSSSTPDQPDQYAQREAFTQSLLRWQSESPTYGLGSALSPATPGSPVTPAQALSDIIRVAGARMPLWDRRQLTGAAQATRASERPTEQGASFYTNVAIMNLISHAIEERIIAERRPCDIYAGFQRLALVRPQLRRYRALSEVARYVYLFGIDDSADDADIHTLGPGVTLRFDIKPELGTGLEHFWFVVVDDPRMPTALLAQHTEGDIWSPRQATRSFTGIWTFDRALVSQIIAILRQAARILYYNNPTA